MPRQGAHELRGRWTNIELVIALVFLDRKLLRMRLPPLQVRGRQTEIGFEQHIHHLQLKLSARRAGEHGTGGPIPLPSIESRMEQPER